MTADEAREHLDALDTAGACGASTLRDALAAVIEMHHRVTTLEAHRHRAERERDDAVIACEALAAERALMLISEADA